MAPETRFTLVASLLHHRPAEPNRVRRFRPRGHDVGPAVTIEIAEGQAVNRALTVTPSSFFKGKFLHAALIKENRSAGFLPPDHEVDIPACQNASITPACLTQVRTSHGP